MPQTKKKEIPINIAIHITKDIHNIKILDGVK